MDADPLAEHRLLAERMVELVRPVLDDQAFRILDTYMAASEYEIVIGMACRVAVDDSLALPPEVLEYEEWMDDEMVPRVHELIGGPIT